METLLSKLIEKLACAEAFEDVAESTLGAAIEIVRTAIQSSAFSKNARVLRAVVHHRPDDGYRRLMGISVGENGSYTTAKQGDPAFVASAFAWQWVLGHETAAAIDLTVGTVMLASGEKLVPSNGKGDSSTKSVARDATHIFVVPLRAPGHRLDGMLAVEASCRPASGSPFVWESCQESLSLLAAIAAPYFTRLPVTRVDRMAPEQYLPVIGQSMQCTVEMLRWFAKQDEPLLLVGPTGAGKSSLARFCHSASPLKNGPFEVIHLADTPEEQQIAELFGMRRAGVNGGAHGPFAPGNGTHHSPYGNGAHGPQANGAKETVGAVTRAEKGTLFIDECDRLTPAAQAAFVRLLDEKRYRMYGDGEERSASVRLIFGTTADLKKLVDAGQFRADLFHRIDVLPVRIAPLRERQDEIIEWAEYMLHRRHAATGLTSESTLSREAARKLIEHDWPSNLRQLDGIIRRSYALAQIDHGSLADGITLRAEHIHRALQYEGKSAPRTLLDHLESAAEAFVAEAERRTETGIRLDMDLADAFKGLVIEAAKRRWSPEDKDAVKKAFLLLGKEATVKSRNHWATYEREIDKVQELRKVMNGGQRTPKHGSNGHTSVAASPHVTPATHVRQPLGHDMRHSFPRSV